MTLSTTVAISVGRAEAKTRSGMETTINPPRSRLIELLAGVSDLNADELREFADCSIGDVVCAISSTWGGGFFSPLSSLRQGSGSPRTADVTSTICG